MPVIVRPVVEDDAAETVDLLNPIIADGRLTVMTAPLTVEGQRAFIRDFRQRGVFLAAVDDEDGGILGIQDVVPIGHDQASAHVGEISTFVREGARRRGIGRLLSRATFAEAPARGFARAMASIRADNAPAIAFYRSQRFRLIGTAERLTRVGGRYIDQVLMERLIA